MARERLYQLMIIFLLLVLAFFIGRSCRQNPIEHLPSEKNSKTGQPAPNYPKYGNPTEQADNNQIAALTNEEVVVAFVKNNARLPDYYITKNEARAQGWNAAQGNLCDVLPGKAIGGDVFTNREGQVPKAPGRRWFEADLNYACGRRNADRMVFSNDGLIFVTHDHYKTFEKK